MGKRTGADERDDGKRVQKKPKVTRHLLNKDGSAWVDQFQLPPDMRMSSEEFNQLWREHPEHKGTVELFGKDIETPRWFQSYGKPYAFSGKEHEAKPVPPLVQRYLDYANEQEQYLEPYAKQEGRFNMALLNWYEDGSHYIGYHSDDESSMLRCKGASIVYSVSFGGKRRFLMKPKKNTKHHRGTLELELRDNCVVVMGGLCQQLYKHSVPKITGAKAKLTPPRINLTARMFV